MRALSPPKNLLIENTENWRFSKKAVFLRSEGVVIFNPSNYFFLFEAQERHFLPKSVSENRGFEFFGGPWRFHSEKTLPKMVSNIQL